MPTPKTQPATAKRSADNPPANPQPAATPAAEPARPVALPWNATERERNIAKRAEVSKARVELAVALRNFCDDDILHLWELSKVIEAYNGNSITPVEDFIVMQGFMYCNARSRGENLTPDHIASDLEECRHWFDMAVEITKKFNAEYADIVSPPQLKHEGKVA